MIKHLNLYEKNGQYFLRAEYQHEDNNGKYSTTFPAIALPFYISDEPPNINFYGGIDSCSFITTNGHRFNIYNELCFNRKNGNIEFVKCMVETLEEKIHEMTMDEIEKKLGYKIKIVTKKEKE